MSIQSVIASHPSEPKCYPLAWHNRSSAACRGDDRRRHGLAEPRAAPARTPPEPAAPLTSVDWRGVVLDNAKKSEPDVRFSCAKISIMARCQMPSSRHLCACEGGAEEDDGSYAACRARSRQRQACPAIPERVRQGLWWGRIRPPAGHCHPVS